jgi:hypothetical protein
MSYSLLGNKIQTKHLPVKSKTRQKATKQPDMNKFIVGTVKGKKQTSLFEPNSPKNESFTAGKPKVMQKKSTAKSNLNVYVETPSLNEFSISKNDSMHVIRPNKTPTSTVRSHCMLMNQNKPSSTSITQTRPQSIGNNGR